jgi:hypothetical protein
VDDVHIFEEAKGRANSLQASLDRQDVEGEGVEDLHHFEEERRVLPDTYHLEGGGGGGED